MPPNIVALNIVASNIEGVGDYLSKDIAILPS